jgi:integrase
LRTHVVPRLGSTPLGRASADDIEALIAAMHGDGKGPKTIVNALTLLHQAFEFGRRKGWCETNRCKEVDRPEVEEDTDIRFLMMEEVEALLRAVPADDPLEPTDRVLYLTAVMTGLRQGELLGLRWRDIDWSAGRVRVRQNFVRGHWGTPKSRRGSRSVPPIASLASSSGTTNARPSRATTTWSSRIPTPARSSTTRRSAAATRRRFATPGCARSASTICDTRSEPAWPLRESPFAPCRSGWGTATSRRR